MRTVITGTQVCAAAFLLICSTAQAHGRSLSHLRPQEMAQVSEGLRTARPNATDPGGTSKWSLIKGFTCLGVCVLGFGSSLVPIKNTFTGDGMFFQWVFCCTLWLGSFVAHSLLGCPRVWLLSVFGGGLWCLGNLSTVPILKTVGLGIGFLIWSMVSLLMGWATARFGWFGLDPQDVPSPTLNYIGTALATVSTLILFFVKTETEQGDREEKEPLLSRNLHRGRFNQLDCVVNEYILGESSNRSWVDRLSSTQRKSMGCLLATCAGVFYGSAYTPIIYIKNKALKNETAFSGASQYDLDYIFSFSTGTFAMSTIAFFGYCMANRNKSILPTHCILPGFFSAAMYAASNCSWLVACYHLGTIITYPIGTAGPALVSLAWSVFYFHEIKGIKNFLILAAVLVTVLSGVMLITFSKIV